jgi:hypothetical protein
MSDYRRWFSSIILATSLLGCADRPPSPGARALEWGPPVGAEVEGWAWSVRLATPVGRPTEPYLATLLPGLVEAWSGCVASSTASAPRQAALELTLHAGRVAAAKVQQGGPAADCVAERLSGRAVAGDDVHLMVGLLPKDGANR